MDASGRHAVCARCSSGRQLSAGLARARFTPTETKDSARETRRSIPRRLLLRRCGLSLPLVWRRSVCLVVDVLRWSHADTDEDGHVAVTGWSGPTTIASDRATGLNSESSNAFAFALIFCAESGRHSLVLAAGSSESQQGVQPLTPSTDDNNENADQDKEPKGDSRLKKWQDLPTWARALIIGGSVAVALVRYSRALLTRSHEDLELNEFRCLTASGSNHRPLLVRRPVSAFALRVTSTC